MAYMCLFQFWFPQGICLGVGLLGHVAAQGWQLHDAGTAERSYPKSKVQDQEWWPRGVTPRPRSRAEAMRRYPR